MTTYIYIYIKVQIVYVYALHDWCTIYYYILLHNTYDTKWMIDFFAPASLDVILYTWALWRIWTLHQYDVRNRRTVCNVGSHKRQKLALLYGARMAHDHFNERTICFELFNWNLIQFNTAININGHDDFFFFLYVVWPPFLEKTNIFSDANTPWYIITFVSSWRRTMVSCRMTADRQTTRILFFYSIRVNR